MPPIKTIYKPKTYVDKLVTHGYSLKINELDDRLEVNGEPITDLIACSIKTLWRENGLTRVNTGMDGVYDFAAKNSYHPIRDYLNSLSYSGGEHIEELASYFSNPDGLFPIWLKRWLIGSVRRVIEKGAQNRMLVLAGPQNIGKSKFAAWLVPQKLRRYFREGPIFPDNKDHRIALSTTWIWEVSELGSTTRRADREALKAFITMEQIDERIPHATYPIHKPALTSFIGTINNENGFLSDPTGNRRFMVCKIDKIDWQGYIDAIDVDRIWAQAYMLYLANEPADLTPDEQALANETNEQFEVEDPLENIILNNFDIDLTRDDWFTPSNEIVDLILDPAIGKFRGTSDRVFKGLSSVMTKLGCDSTRSTRKKIRGYRFIQRKLLSANYTMNNP
jgi:predicted P-loop ATPase